MFPVILGYALARAFIPRTTKVSLGRGEILTWFVSVERATRKWEAAMRDSRLVPMGRRGVLVWVNPRAVVYMEGRYR